MALPQTAVPLVGPSVCDSFPAGEPGVRSACGVFPEAPIAIDSVVTQCPAPGCSKFVAQTNPPITIVGAGFGTFPGGAPFTGASQYLRIVDNTQHWSAGYTGDVCTVSISSWADNLIQFSAKVSHQQQCPLLGGDTVQVEVWNPQTMTSVTSEVTVSAN
jgi:hypothetical protein